MSKKYVIHAESDSVAELLQLALQQANEIAAANNALASPATPAPAATKGTLSRLTYSPRILTDAEKASILLTHNFSGENTGFTFTPIFPAGADEISIKYRDEEDQILNYYLNDQVELSSYDFLPGGWIIAEFESGLGLFCLEDCVEYCSVKETEKVLTFKESIVIEEISSPENSTGEDVYDVEYFKGDQLFDVSILEHNVECDTMTILYISKETKAKVVALDLNRELFKELKTVN